MDATEQLLKSVTEKLTEDEYDAIVNQAWNSGFDSGSDKAVDSVVSILQGHTSRNFLDNNDAIANYTRDLISEVKGLKKG